MGGVLQCLLNAASYLKCFQLILYTAEGVVTGSLCKCTIMLCVRATIIIVNTCTQSTNYYLYFSLSHLAQLGNTCLPDYHY